MGRYLDAAGKAAYIFVPGFGHWVSVKSYVTAIRKAKANLDETFSYSLTCWTPCTGREIMEQFRAGIHERINEALDIPWTRKRKDSWQAAIVRDRHRLEDIRRRIRVYQFETPEMMRRFGHLLARYDD